MVSNHDEKGNPQTASLTTYYFVRAYEVTDGAVKKYYAFAGGTVATCANRRNAGCKYCIILAGKEKTDIPVNHSSDNQMLEEITRRIVRVAKPSRVLLFGSAASGRMTKDSDLDVLVVMGKPVHRRQIAQEIYQSLRGVGIAVDIVVATEEDLQTYGQRAGTILQPALREGRVLYEA